MDIYLDFEATQFKENVIAIGAYCDRGSFDCLVKPPKGDRVTNFISKLTGITSEMAENALSIDEAFWDLYEWIYNITQDNFGGPTFFHVFGNMDKIFLRNTAQFCQSKIIKTFIENLAESLIDDSKKVCQYFHIKSIGVYRALKYFEPNAPEQDHDPLNDAIALQNLMFHINFAVPLEESPFETFQKIKTNCTPDDCCIIATHLHEPSAKPKYFKSIKEAETWVIQKIHSKNKNASKETIKKNFAKALKNNSNYNGWNWKKQSQKKEVN